MKGGMGLVEHAFRYSFVISWYSLFIVPGGGRACVRMRANSTRETPTPSMVILNIYQPSPGGGRARGP